MIFSITHLTMRVCQLTIVSVGGCMCLAVTNIGGIWIRHGFIFMIFFAFLAYYEHNHRDHYNNNYGPYNRPNDQWNTSR